jgi:hypothetical protein
MNLPEPDPLHKPKFLEEVRPALRVRHYSIRTGTQQGARPKGTGPRLSRTPPPRP